MTIQYPGSMSRQSKGQLQVDVRALSAYLPIENATVLIKKSGDDAKTIETLKTDDSGQTITVDVDAPDKALSLEPNNTERPYAEYTIEVRADHYEPTVVEGSQILADTKALQGVELPNPKANNTSPSATTASATRWRQDNVIVIEPHTLYGIYPAKIPEDPVKPKPTQSSGLIVLNQVVVPEFIVVHDGSPYDPAAPNYYIFFKDYIKNVASSEIYSTWPESTITANILAILSFTLNRVYTEWYRAKGFNFTITSSTAYDHKFIYGRNIYQNISQIVDKIFVNYITKPGIEQPLLTQYCDGNRVKCPGWMTDLLKVTTIYYAFVFNLILNLISFCIYPLTPSFISNA